jgi:hypothetical protein
MKQFDLADRPAGALELILECHEMLAGQRAQFTPLHEYRARRLRFWQAQASQRSRASRWSTRKAA